MKAAEMLVKQVLNALPEEMRAGLAEAISVLPTFAKNAQSTFASIDAQLKTLEHMERYNTMLLMGLYKHFNITVPTPYTVKLAAPPVLVAGAPNGKS